MTVGIRHTLAVLVLASPLLIGVSAGHIYDEVSGHVEVTDGQRVVEVRLVLTVTNVRQTIEALPSCRLGSPSGDRLPVAVDTGGDFGPLDLALADLQIPSSWEPISVPLTLRCRRDVRTSDSMVFRKIVVRARPRGGCTASGCIGPDASISIEVP